VGREEGRRRVAS
jgi:hypothetical protein